MKTRPLLTAVGAGVTTFFVVAVAVIEILQFEFSAIIGLPVGALAGIGALIATLTAFEGMNRAVVALLTGYAVVGYTIITVAALRYSNVAGVLETVSVDTVVALAVLVGAVVAAVVWVLDDPS